jgi:hypothetical protein
MAREDFGWWLSMPQADADRAGYFLAHRDEV